MESLDYQYFSNYFKKFKQYDSKKFDLALEHVHNYANEHGLSEEDLILISKIIFKQQFGVSKIRNVMKCLIPRCSMPDEVVEHVINWIWNNYNKNISVFSKKIVLQWLIGLIQHNLINPAKTIRLHYDLLWYFLPYQIINVSACHLIYLLATPEDVNRWYVKQVLKVHENFDRPKYTGALLLLFKSYRPDCVPENIPAYAVHKAFGFMPEFITKLFSKAQERLERKNIILKDVDSICWYSTNINVKKNAVQLIPNITESEINKLDGSKPLTSISDSKDLHKYLIQGNMPNRSLSLLSNQDSRFILIFGGKDLHERFSFQLYYTLYDAFLERNPNVPYEEKDNLLKILCGLQNQMQQSIPVVSKFLTLYIIRWDGFEHKDHIYGLLEWLNFESYEALETSILYFFRDLFVSGTVETKCTILTTLAKITVNTLNTYQYRVVENIPCIFLDAPVKWEFKDVIFKMYEYVTNMCKLGWVTTQGHGLMAHTILSVNFMIMSTEESCGLKIWEVPTFICNAGLFTSSPSFFLRMFTLFNRFPSYVSHTVIKDYINSLINKKAFISKNKTSVFAIFSKEQIQTLQKLIGDIHGCLSFGRHLAVACFYPTRNQQDIKAYEEFIGYIRDNYPDFLEFIVKNT